MSKAYRPSHADATYDFKYGVRSVQVRLPKFCTLEFDNNNGVIPSEAIMFNVTYAITTWISENIGWW